MNDIMIDLETLDTLPTAVILSIGAVRMDLEKLELKDEFYQIIRPCFDFGQTMSADTVLWWLQQSDGARAMFRAPAELVCSLPEALQKFSAWVTRKAERVNPYPPVLWGNGATFDNVILRHAYRACGHVYPASHRDDLCYRTLRRVLGGRVKKLETGVAHNALDDARNQALNMLEIIRGLRK